MTGSLKICPCRKRQHALYLTISGRSQPVGFGSRLWSLLSNARQCCVQVAAKLCKGMPPGSPMFS
jgi:hypothetical protein